MMERSSESVPRGIRGVSRIASNPASAQVIHSGTVNGHPSGNRTTRLAPVGMGRRETNSTCVPT